MNTEKKMAAAIAAVMDYIKTEEEAVCMQAAAGQVAPSAEYEPQAPMKMWGVSGRQAIMQMRGLMQMRTFKATRF